MKSGYLNEHFKIFHLTDADMRPVGLHFHDFHKILILLKGNVDYRVAGRSYELSGNEIVLIPAGEAHCPVLLDRSAYERIVFYISRDFLDSCRSPGGDLALCLKQAHEKRSHVLRAPAFLSSRLGRTVRELEEAFRTREYADQLYRQILFLEFMVQLNRILLHEHGEDLKNCSHKNCNNQDCNSKNCRAEIPRASSADARIPAVLQYLDDHLTDDISIDALARTFYLSRYYLMHLFKEETGSTIGGYLNTRRLLLARKLIRGGMRITEACYSCGFKNYSTFLRAYKKYFRCSPRESLLL